MGTVELPRDPQMAAPPKSRYIPSDEEQQQEINRVLEEETEKLIRYLKGKLSDDAVYRLDIKEAVNRYITEILGYFTAACGSSPDRVTGYHSADVAGLLHSLGGIGQFNRGEIETAREDTHNPELYINMNMPRKNAGADAYLCEENSGSIVKCVFRDNVFKPATVSDVKLAVNIPDSALFNPIFYRIAASQFIIRDFITSLISSIEKEKDPDGRKLEERISRLLAEDFAADKPLSERVNKSAEIERIRERGFNRAANHLAAILSAVGLEYQCVENKRGERELSIREYEDSDSADLPDERYEIRLKYLDSDRLARECAAYDEQIGNFENKTRHLWDLIEVIYQDSKSVFKVNDFEDLAKKNKSRIAYYQKIRDNDKKKNGEQVYNATGEASFNKNEIRTQIARMHERIKNMNEYLYPIERRAMEERLAFLETEYSRVDFLVNPRHVQPGLLFETEMASIKRKKTTVDAMAAALREFLHRVMADFQ